jgi:hypothetical protein
VRLIRVMLLSISWYLLFPRDAKSFLIEISQMDCECCYQGKIGKENAKVYVPPSGFTRDGLPPKIEWLTQFDRIPQFVLLEGKELTLRSTAFSKYIYNCWLNPNKINDFIDALKSYLHYSFYNLYRTGNLHTEKEQAVLIADGKTVQVHYCDFPTEKLSSNDPLQIEKEKGFASLLEETNVISIQNFLNLYTLQYSTNISIGWAQHQGVAEDCYYIVLAEPKAKFKIKTTFIRLHADVWDTITELSGDLDKED